MLAHPSYFLAALAVGWLVIRILAETKAAEESNPVLQGITAVAIRTRKFSRRRWTWLGSLLEAVTGTLIIAVVAIFVFIVLTGLVLVGIKRCGDRLGGLFIQNTTRHKATSDDV